MTNESLASRTGRGGRSGGLGDEGTRKGERASQACGTVRRLRPDAGVTEVSGVTVGEPVTNLYFQSIPTYQQIQMAILVRERKIARLKT